MNNEYDLYSSNYVINIILTKSNVDLLSIILYTKFLNQLLTGLSK